MFKSRDSLNQLYVPFSLFVRTAAPLKTTRQKFKPRPFGLHAHMKFNRPLIFCP